MSLQRITDRIWVLPYDSFTDRPNLYYIRGDERSLAVDAGASPAHVADFYRAIEAEGLPLPQVTAITHWHWDHTFGLCAVVGQTISSAATLRQLETVQRWAWDRPAMQRREHTGEDIAFCNMCIMREYAAQPERIRVALPQVGLTENRTLDLGGIQAVLLPCSSPHSEDALLIHIPQEKALIVGDADCEDYYHQGGMYQQESLSDWIQRVRELDYDHYLIGHGEPETKDDALHYLQGQLDVCIREAEPRKLVRAYRGDYISKMRRIVGHAPLMGTGCSVLLENEKGEILLQKRRDNGCWAPPGGALNMGETAEDAARREAWEEAGVVVGNMRLLGVYTGEDRYVFYPNGDICYITLVAFISNDFIGDPMQNTDEAVEHRFFAKDNLPDNLNRCDERSIRQWAAGELDVVCR